MRGQRVGNRISRIARILRNLSYEVEVWKDKGVTYAALATEVVHDGPTCVVQIAPITEGGVPFVRVHASMRIQEDNTIVLNEIDDDCMYNHTDGSWILSNAVSDDGSCYVLTRILHVKESWFAPHWLGQVHMLMVDIRCSAYALIQRIELIASSVRDEESDKERPSSIEDMYYLH